MGGSRKALFGNAVLSAVIALVEEADAFKRLHPLLDRLARRAGADDFDLVETAGQRLGKLVGNQRPEGAQDVP